MSAARRILLAALVLLSACVGAGRGRGPAASAAPSPPGAPALELAWQGPLDVEHPLVGAVWDARAQRFVDQAELRARLAQARFVLLGERHDHPDHHTAQALLLRWAAPTVVGLEMLDEEDAAGLPGATVDTLAAAVDWPGSGWPDFALYRPVIAAVFDVGAALRAVHPAADRVRRVMMEGYGVLADDAAALGLDQPLPPEQAKALREEIEASHCGYAQGDLVEMMARGQRLKDSWMARELAGAERAVLIAGGGHVREDRAVGALLPDPLSVVFVEVRAGRRDPRSYGDDGVDLQIFTPRLDDLDPCERFAEQLKDLGPARTD